MRIGLPLLEALSRAGCGGLILTAQGEVQAINAVARAILGAELGLSEAAAEAEPSREALKALLVKGGTRFRLDRDNWVVIPREGRRPLILQALLIPRAGPDEPHTALILVDLDVVPQPNQTAIEQVFGLTPAEARLTILLTLGATPAEAARLSGTSLHTVRSQLAAIYAKTRTRRQAELISLAARLAILP